MVLRTVKYLQIVCIICTVIYIILTSFNIVRKNNKKYLSFDVDYENIVLNNMDLKKNFTNEEKQVISSTRAKCVQIVHDKKCSWLPDGRWFISVEKMSALGRWLISPEGSPPPTIVNSRSTPYLILIWKHGPFLENRHIRRFSSQKFSPWENCSVRCLLSYNSKDVEKANAVIFHLHRTSSVNELPIRKNYNQRWIFLTDESPFNTFLYSSQKISEYNKLFNWSMTYRMDSDIPVPYGRTVQSSTVIKQSYFYKKLKRKDKLLAIMGSNCGGNNNRWNYVSQLKKILGSNLDIFGHCLGGNRTICPGHFKRDCKELERYKFYLSFENSNCREYLTEKVFWNAYEKFAIPVIMGAPQKDCKRLLPPNSFLHIDEFSSPISLADYLKYLGENQEYFQFHLWRSRYKVINEHGYFGSNTRHYCRVCEALHYNSINKKVYDKLEDFWNKSKDCNL